MGNTEKISDIDATSVIVLLSIVLLVLADETFILSLHNTTIAIFILSCWESTRRRRKIKDELSLKTDLFLRDIVNDFFLHLDVLHMLTMFLKHTGHMERAVAVYQAMIELNVFCPDVLKKANKKVPETHYLHCSDVCANFQRHFN